MLATSDLQHLMKLITVSCLIYDWLNEMHTVKHFPDLIWSTASYGKELAVLVDGVSLRTLLPH